MKDQTEMDKLAEWMGEHAAEYGLEWVHDNKPRELSGFGQDWNQIIAYKGGIYVFDAICHYGSYGYEKGLLEIMGACITDGADVVGNLTAEKVIERIQKANL